MEAFLFEWDESKRRDVRRTRTVDVGDLATAFRSPVIARVDRREPDGEIRFEANDHPADRHVVTLGLAREVAVTLRRQRPRDRQGSIEEILRDNAAYAHPPRPSR